MSQFSLTQLEFQILSELFDEYAQTVEERSFNDYELPNNLAYRDILRQVYEYQKSQHGPQYVERYAWHLDFKESDDDLSSYDSWIAAYLAARCLHWSDPAGNSDGDVPTGPELQVVAHLLGVMMVDPFSLYEIEAIEEDDEADVTDLKYTPLENTPTGKDLLTDVLTRVRPDGWEARIRALRASQERVLVVPTMWLLDYLATRCLNVAAATGESIDGAVSCIAHLRPDPSQYVPEIRKPVVTENTAHTGPFPHWPIRLIGLFMLLASIVGDGFVWRTALINGRHLELASLSYPALGFIGLSLLLYPISKAEARVRYGSDQIAWRQMPQGQKVLLVIGVVAGVLQLIVINQL